MIRVRKVVFNDCKACRKLSNTKELLTSAGTVVPASWFRAFVKGKGIFLVAEEGNIIGYVMGERVTGIVSLLWMMAVDKRNRGKGIGKALLAAFEKESKKRGGKVVVLYAPLFNPKTLKFYRKSGYLQGIKMAEFSKKL
ncbi:MAG: GNAT family N-acetyltransferase [Candidatus Aenigmarchaeota archaeon]|nr:GNAT family N-acetyltransferase [Candidatus Aenigmarchaeota archaeon]